VRTFIEGKTTAAKNAAKTRLPPRSSLRRGDTIKYRDRRGSMTRLCRTCIYERNPSRGGFGGEQKGRHSESSMATRTKGSYFCWKLKEENGEIIF
jgi:hypothetical protein